VTEQTSKDLKEVIEKNRIESKEATEKISKDLKEVMEKNRIESKEATEKISKDLKEVMEKNRIESRDANEKVSKDLKEIVPQIAKLNNFYNIATLVIFPGIGSILTILFNYFDVPKLFQNISKMKLYN